MFTQSDLGHIERGRRDYGVVLSLLRGAGSLWHRTSTESLRAILASGHIYPNKGRFPMTYPQSRLCYGRAINAVCLFDFNSASEDEIFWQSIKWGPFVTDQKPATVWIEIPRSRLDSSRLSSALDFRGGNLLYVPVPAGEEGLFSGGKYVPTFIPYIEAWHRGPIAVSAFSRYLVFGEPENATEHRSVATGPNAIEEIAAIGAEWAQRSKERGKAHLAAGGINLAEILKRADAMAKARRDRDSES